MAALAATLAIVALGKPFLDLLTALTGVTISQNWLTITLGLLFGFMVAASILPSLCIGVGFAISAFCFGWARLPAAWAVAGLGVIGFVALGAATTPSENSPLIVIPVGEVRQAMYLCLFLMVPAVVASTLAWLASRPFHRRIGPA